MNKKKMILTDAFLNKACKNYRDNEIPEFDEQESLNKINKLIDERIVSQSTQSNERKVVEPIRKRRKTLRPLLAMTACAAICAVAVTGGLMENFKPPIQSTNPGTQSSATGSTEQNMDIPKDDQATPTDKSVTYQKENEISDTMKGKIMLTGGYEDINYINPTKIQLKKSGIKKGTCKWTITSYVNNNLIYKGSGTVINKELSKMIENKNDGDYIITYKYKDSKGNNYTQHKGFSINTKTLPSEEGNTP